MEKSNNHFDLANRIMLKMDSTNSDMVIKQIFCIANVNICKHPSIFSIKTRSAIFVEDATMLLLNRFFFFIPTLSISWSPLPKKQGIGEEKQKKSMKMWREFVTRGFQIAQLEERISLLINIFAFLKTWRARYLYYLARHVFGFLISLFSMQIRSSNWP